MRSLTSLSLVMSCGAVMLGTQALAQANATATKTASPYVYSLFENAYSRLESRHYTKVGVEKADGDVTSNTKPMVQFRPVIGTKLAPNLLTELAFRINKNTGTSKLEQAAPYSYTEWTALNNDYVSIVPYAEILLPSGGAGTTGNANFDVILKAPVPATPIGKISPFIDIDAEVAVNSRDEKTEKVQRDPSRPGYGLSSDDDKPEAVNQQEPSTNQTYSAGLSFVPSFLPALYLEARTGLNKDFKPKYKEVDADGDPRLQKEGYAVRDTTEGLLQAIYTVNERVTLRNDFFHRTGGFYASRNTEGLGAPAIENVLRLSYKLF